MASNYFRVKRGLNLEPLATAVSAEGDLAWNSTSHKLEYRDNSATRGVVSEDSTQTLTGKTLTGNTAVNLISGSGTVTLNTSGTVTLPNATDTLVGKATTDVLTNKTLSGNTAVTLISGSGTLTLNTSNTVTLPNATDTLVGKATTDVLTNKTLSGNTAVTLISGSGTLTLNTSGTVTLPNATDTLVGKATTDTLTGKTLDGGSNTFTNIPNTATTASSSVGTSTIVSRDASGNTTSAHFNDGYTTVATAGATTTLTVTSNTQQYFTGVTTQTVSLPATSTLTTGYQFTINNLSSGVVTVQSSGGNTLQAMAANTQLIVVVISTAGTGTSSWNWTYENLQTSLPMINPMTTGGDIIYGGASGAPTRLANGSAGTVLMSNGTTTAPTWSADLSAVTTLSKTTGVALHGTNTNDNAAAGYLGEYIESVISTSSAPSAGTFGDLTNISLTAGDWDVTFIMYLDRNSAAGFAGGRAGISTTTGNSNTGLVLGSNYGIVTTIATAVLDTIVITIANYRASLSTTTVHYAKVLASYSSGTPQIYGRLSARRVR